MATSPGALVKVCGTKLLQGDSREKYRQKLARITLDSMVQFVGLLNADGTVLEINQVALDAVGISLSEVEGRPFWTTFWWQVSNQINRGLRDAIRRAARGEFVRWDTEIYGRAGGKETIIIDASLMPVKDEHGKVVFIAAEGRDITEKKAYEREIARQREELAEIDKLKTRFFANISHEFRTQLTLMMGKSEQRFRAFVAACSDVVFQVSPDWKTMRHLEGGRFIPDTQSPDNTWLSRYIYPDDRLMFMAAINHAIETRSTFELEHRVLSKGGAIGWASSRAIPLIDANGEISEWFGAATDITARKHAEEALVRNERLASLGRMAATISHEINNPLEALSNLLYLAEMTDDLPERARELIHEADAELQRVAHITRQALGFYRESNAAEDVSINSVIESVIALLRNKIAAKSVFVDRQWHTKRQVKAVAGELRQVFSNLILNCLDAVDDGGTVKIRIGQGTISGNRPAVRITFVDNGKGIEAATRSRIFEPLFTTKGAVGTGLGLWVSKQIVEKHHGRIQMHSCTSGKRRGSTFSILLPQ